MIEFPPRMGTFRCDTEAKSGILVVQLEGGFSVDEMRAFVSAHNQAVDEFAGTPYRVFVDIRGLQPLSPEAAEIMETAKAYSAARGNFQGSAVLAPGPLVAMQHRRTSVAGGVIETELISADEQACWEHLRNVQRAPARKSR